MPAPILKAFCTDLRGNFYRSHYKSLTPVTLHCWYSSTIFYFVCFVTEYFGLWPRKCTLGLSRGLTGMKCELSPSGFATTADLCKLVPESLYFLCQGSQMISHFILKWQMRKYSQTTLEGPEKQPASAPRIKVTDI